MYLIIIVCIFRALQSNVYTLGTHLKKKEPFLINSVFSSVSLFHKKQMCDEKEEDICQPD